MSGILDPIMSLLLPPAAEAFTEMLTRRSNGVFKPNDDLQPMQLQICLSSAKGVNQHPLNVLDAVPEILLRRLGELHAFVSFQEFLHSSSSRTAAVKLFMTILQAYVHATDPLSQNFTLAQGG